MTHDEDQTSTPPVSNGGDSKPPVADPRDDLYEKVATHRRDLQAFLALRRQPRGGPGTTRH